MANATEIKQVNINDLVPYENNPRNNEQAVDKVANSIKEFGFKYPIVVDEDMVIISGHTRRLAALRLGLETVPVIIADDLTEDQKKALRIADNKTGELAAWDWGKLDQELKALAAVNFDMQDFGFDVVAADDDLDGLWEEEDKPKAEPASKTVVCPHCGMEIQV